MTPQPVDQELTKRALDSAEFVAKFAGSAGIVWAFVSKVWKPYIDWRRKHMALMMREILKDELQQLRDVLDKEDGCVGRLEALALQITELFGEHDLMLDVMLDNRDRLDETNDLLDTVGFSNERRDITERRAEILEMVSTLADRRRERRRRNSTSSRTFSVRKPE